MYDANLLVLNMTDYDSNTDGAGSGADEATSGGREVDVAEGADVIALMTLGEADGTVANASETLAMLIEISRDGGGSGGNTWGTAATFRSIIASEISGASGVTLDESAGGVTFKRAVMFNVGLAESGQNGIIKLRCNGTASDSNQWAVTVMLVNREMVREEWLDNAYVS